MKDRIPATGKAGLIKLTDPETGIEKLYFMALADDPTEVGTKLSKANLLTDQTTQKLFGSTADKTVNDALMELASSRIRTASNEIYEMTFDDAGFISNLGHDVNYSTGYGIVGVTKDYNLSTINSTVRVHSKSTGSVVRSISFTAPSSHNILFNIETHPLSNIFILHFTNSGGSGVYSICCDASSGIASSYASGPLAYLGEDDTYVYVSPFRGNSATKWLNGRDRARIGVDSYTGDVYGTRLYATKYTKSTMAYSTDFATDITSSFPYDSPFFACLVKGTNTVKYIAASGVYQTGVIITWNMANNTVSYTSITVADPFGLSGNFYTYLNNNSTEWYYFLCDPANNKIYINWKISKTSIGPTVNDLLFGMYCADFSTNSVNKLKNYSIVSVNLTANNRVYAGSRSRMANNVQKEYYIAYYNTTTKDSNNVVTTTRYIIEIDPNTFNETVLKQTSETGGSGSPTISYNANINDAYKSVIPTDAKYIAVDYNIYDTVNYNKHSIAYKNINSPSSIYNDSSDVSCKMMNFNDGILIVVQNVSQPSSLTQYFCVGSIDLYDTDLNGIKHRALYATKIIN